MAANELETQTLEEFIVGFPGGDEGMFILEGKHNYLHDFLLL